MRRNLKKQQHRHALCPRCWQTPTKRKPVMLLQDAIIDRAENRTVKYYQRWKIMPPAGDHHQTNTSTPGAAAYFSDYRIISYHISYIISYIISYHISYHIIYHISYDIIYHIISYHISCQTIYHISYHIISYHIS